MPLPTDERILNLSHDLIAQLDAMFGEHPGFRPAHAKGALLRGTFTPTSAAASLSRAPHLNSASTPVTVRFSDGTGLPTIPDNDGNAAPRGMSVRFHLGERVHTDIVSHSTNGFPARNGQEFLEFLRAAAASVPGTPSPTPIEAFLGSHPAALAFVQAPKPAPSSFGREAFFGVNAMRFITAAGVARYGRYRILPSAGTDYLSPDSAAAKDPNYLFDELARSVAGRPIGFRILVQLANDGDIVVDPGHTWPEDRTFIDIGTLSLTTFVPDSAEEQRNIIFDPIPRVDGIEPSDDSLLELRAAIYLLSGRRRRAAAGTAAARA